MAAIIEHNKYNSSRIYKISSSLTDKIYIGSTTQTLSQRMGGHNRHYKLYLKDNTKLYVSSFEIIKLGDAFIKLIEESNYNNKQQLEKREGEIIKDNINICVNKVIAGRTIHEWRDDNKEIIAKKMKQYNQDNKKVVAEKAKQYRQDNVKIIAEYNKQYQQYNKEIIAEKAKKTYICECGKTLTICHKSSHEKSKKHISFITNQYYINELNI